MWSLRVKLDSRESLSHQGKEENEKIKHNFVAYAHAKLLDSVSSVSFPHSPNILGLKLPEFQTSMIICKLNQVF